MNLPPNILRSLGVTETALADSSSRAIPSTPRGRLVPNQFPPVTGAPYRVAIIGEAPGAEEDEKGVPFSGASGRYLDAILTAEGLSRLTVFVGNVCNFRPPDNDLKAFDWKGPEIQESLVRLTEDITKFNPNICVLLGRYAVYAATGEWRSISEWRGSVFEGKVGPFAGRKCIATYHPAAVLRQEDWMPLLRHDLHKAGVEGRFPDIVSLKRNLRTGLSATQIVESLESITATYDAAERSGGTYPALWVSYDIEGYWDRITRFSFATSPTEGFIVPITAGEYDSHWSFDEECRIWYHVSRVLQDPRIPKVLQNSLYDRFVLAYNFKILISNVAHDTMLGHWELYCELPNNLGLQASLYTNEPYWKEDREADSLQDREIYCCKDSAVTEEIRQVQTPKLKADYRLWNHCQFNLRLLNPVLYMELRGLKYDSQAAANALSTRVLPELWSLKHQLNIIAGKCFVGTRELLLDICRKNVCKKREANYLMTFGQLPSLCLKNKLDAAVALSTLDSLGLLSDTALATRPDVLGEVEYWLDIELNVDSTPQMRDWMYIQKRYPRQYKKDKKGQPQLSCDVMALLEIYRRNPSDNAPKLVLQIRSLLYQAQILRIKSDPDGRVRCGYNEVAAETGRIACYESPTGSGYNLQTVTKKLRYLFRADDGCWLGQFDLAGADGWTVAAHCASLGDSVMLDDYKYGLKPARLIALMYMELEREIKDYRATTNKEPAELWLLQAIARISNHFNSLSRADLKKLSKQVDSEGWLYFGSKRVQHGTNYDAQQNTVSGIILKDSHKFLGEPIYVEPRICGLLQKLYLNRYLGIPRWHTRVANTLLQSERLISASGRIRRFFGRIRSGRDVNHETFKAALSNEPQDNTTYSCNWAMYNVWYDSDNRCSGYNQGLIVEPIHQVHDAMLLQWPKSETDFARLKIPRWFNNEMTIAGVKVTIPFEGAFGEYWGDNSGGEILPLIS